MRARSRSDWSGFEPAAIPTKSELPQLEHWLERSVPAGARIVDVGCGAGLVAARLAARGLDVVGLDINAGAIEQCRRSVQAARFYERDVASARGFEMDDAPFDFAVCAVAAKRLPNAACNGVAQPCSSSFDPPKPSATALVPTQLSLLLRDPTLGRG